LMNCALVLGVFLSSHAFLLDCRACRVNFCCLCISLLALFFVGFVFLRFGFVSVFFCLVL
jgi:hypothetical protein